MKLKKWRTSLHGCAPVWLILVAALLTVTSSTLAQSNSASGSGAGRQRLPSLPWDGRINDRLTWIGSVTSQGDSVMGAPAARSTYGVNGAGVKIGIISDSFNFLAGMAAGVAAGDLPGVGNPNGFVTPINILNDDLAAGSTDEGRALAEIIHDVAPGAELLFHSAFNNANPSPGATIAAAINNLAAAGADVIIDDVIQLTMPAYQDGAAALAAKAAAAAGIPYFSAAGNNSNNAYEKVFTPIGINHNFDSDASELQNQDLFRIGSVPNGGLVRAVLWWDDPYPSLGSGAVTSDFDFGLFDITDINNPVLVSSSIQDQIAGADAFEFVAHANTSGSTSQYAVIVQHFDGVVTKQFKIQVFGSTISDDDDTNSPTTWGQNSAEGAVAVAAHSVFNLGAAEPFTSHGPTTILYDEDGNPLTVPEIRDAPQITGPDGGNTSFLGTDVLADADSFPNLFGTSGSVAHVAAVAALVLERAADLGQSLTPAQLYDILFSSAIDIGAPDFDNVTGWGRLDAFAAVGRLVPEPGTGITSLLAAIGLTGLRVRRR
jgi:hypothetical protein